MMKSTLHSIQALLLVFGFLLPQAVHAEGRDVGHGGSKELSIEKLRSPKWNNSLHGYGSLNITRGLASAPAPDSDQKTESQVGPIRLTFVDATPPNSFTGSLSRVVSNPSYNPNY